MRMNDYIRELDSILQSTGRMILMNAGNISHEKAIEKATLEYRKYKAMNLSDVEKAYVESLKNLRKSVEENVKNNKRKISKE